MTILDGKLVAAELEEQMGKEILSLKEKTGKVPGLTVIIVGEDPASQIYVRNKDRMAASLGVNSHIIRMSEDVGEAAIIAEINRLNNDDDVDAVLVQLPLPARYDTWKILDYLDPSKDVDRFHPANIGMISVNRTKIYPCTPFGILKILERYNINLSGKHAVVVGRSFIVGKPMAAMLTNLDATVTLCHSKTSNLGEIIRQGDVVVAAIGKPGFVTADMVKDGAILIDVGMNYLESEADVMALCEEDQIKKFRKRGYGITGDIHKDAFKKSSYYTPVPGGVGLTTVTMLMYNTIQLFKQRRGIS